MNRITAVPLPAAWRCVRCRQHFPECAPEAGNYGLCLRCQDFMHHEMNWRCVSCGGDDAEDNLCAGCQAERIAAWDAAYAASRVAL